MRRLRRPARTGSRADGSALERCPRSARPRHARATAPCGPAGASYDPASDSWNPLSEEGAPTARADAAAVWTGTEMLIWGGRGGGVPSAPLGDGARYSPATNTWAPLPAAGAPSARFLAAVAWTGGRMAVWGGCERRVFRCGGSARRAHVGRRTTRSGRVLRSGHGFMGAVVGRGCLGPAGRGESRRVPRCDRRSRAVPARWSRRRRRGARGASLLHEHVDGRRAALLGRPER